MANITRKQIKNQIEKLIEQLNELYSDLEDLKLGTEDEADSIEPYEYNDDLTSAQEERKEWLEGCAEQLGQALEEVENAISSLEYID